MLIIGNLKIYTNKRGLITTSTFTRHRQTPINLKRVKVHAIRRELPTSVLD